VAVVAVGDIVAAVPHPHHERGEESTVVEG